jgi:hypothetical protein
MQLEEVITMFTQTANAYTSFVNAYRRKISVLQMTLAIMVAGSFVISLFASSTNNYSLLAKCIIFEVSSPFINAFIKTPLTFLVALPIIIACFAIIL